MYIYMYMYICIYICICIYVHIYIYISYTETGTRRTPRWGVWSGDAGVDRLAGQSSDNLQEIDEEQLGVFRPLVRSLVRSFVVSNHGDGKSPRPGAPWGPFQMAELLGLSIGVVPITKWVDPPSSD